MANKCMKRWVTWEMQTKATWSHPLLKSWGWGWPRGWGRARRSAAGVTLCYCRGELGRSSILYGPTTPNQLSQTWFPTKTKTSFYTDLYTVVQTTQMRIRRWMGKWTMVDAHSEILDSKEQPTYHNMDSARQAEMGGQNQTVFLKFHLYKILPNVQ